MLMLCMLLVGFGEEGMFRVVGVVSLRQHGFDRGQGRPVVKRHLRTRPRRERDRRRSEALGQAVIVSFAGYFFYLIRRVSRSNLLNSVLHAGFDFTVISSTQIFPEGEDVHAAGAAVAILVYLVCGVIVVVRRHKIEPAVPAQPVNAANA